MTWETCWLTRIAHKATAKLSISLSIWNESATYNVQKLLARALFGEHIRVIIILGQENWHNNQQLFLPQKR